MSGNQSKTTISRHFCSTVLRFYSTDVRKTLYNADFTKCSFASSFFVVLQHWCPENIVKQRFHEIFVRQFYVFGTLMSGKQSKTTIRRPKCATVLRFRYQNSAKAIFERQFYILNKKCRKHRVFTCFCDFFWIEAMLEHKRAKKKTPHLLRLASETRFRDVLEETKKPRKCDRGLRFHVFDNKIKTIQISKTTILTQRGLKK